MRQAAAAAAGLLKFAPFKPFSTRDSIERLLWGASHIIMWHPDPECSVSARFGLLVDYPQNPQQSLRPQPQSITGTGA